MWNNLFSFFFPLDCKLQGARTLLLTVLCFTPSTVPKTQQEFKKYLTDEGMDKISKECLNESLSHCTTRWITQHRATWDSYYGLLVWARHYIHRDNAMLPAFK